MLGLCRTNPLPPGFHFAAAASCTVLLLFVTEKEKENDFRRLTHKTKKYDFYFW
jgi:hypothetical protein